MKLTSLYGVTTGEITKDTPRVPVNGWYQGAVMRFGKGRLAVFGEAAMFSAQLVGPEKRQMGMNSPIASKNPQFLLNVTWLMSYDERPHKSLGNIPPSEFKRRIQAENSISELCH